MIFIVVYTPKEGGRELNLLDKIQASFTSWAKLNKNVFLVDPNNDAWTAYEIKKVLASMCEDGGKLFIAYLTQYASWSGYDARMFMWVKEHDKKTTQSQETRNTYDSNHMKISDYYESVSNKSDEADIVSMMEAKWASTWDEMKPMYFDCKDFNKSDVLVKFVAEVYLSIQSNVFLHRVKLLNFPENLKEQLLKELNSRGEQNNRQFISQSDFANLFKGNEAEIN